MLAEEVDKHESASLQKFRKVGYPPYENENRQPKSTAKSLFQIFRFKGSIALVVIAVVNPFHKYLSIVYLIGQSIF